jgi:phosphoribosylanthranilate isomerase
LGVSFAKKLFDQNMGKTKIKASGVNNLTDARYFAAREVEWLGFKIGDDASSIKLLAAKAIAEWVDGVKIVGEFEFATAAEIRAAQAQFPFDVVQVGMFTPVYELEALAGITIIQEVVVEKSTTETELLEFFKVRAPYCAYFLLDLEKAGLDWAMLNAGGLLSITFLQQLFREYKTLLALDFPPEAAGNLLALLGPAGLSVSGGGEEKVGFKSFDDLDEILDCLETLA